MIRFLTAGESHGVACSTIVEGTPSGIRIEKSDFERELILRQAGYCRGWRQAVEKNELEITSGIHNSLTTGAPVSIIIYNTEGVNNPLWRKSLSAYPEELEGFDIPLDEAVHEKKRDVFIPGHADLPGILKYRHIDNNLRFISDRASARETIVRVAVGAIAKKILAAFGINIFSYVSQIGDAVAKDMDFTNLQTRIDEIDNEIINNFRKTVDNVNQKGLKIFDVSNEDLTKNRKEIIQILKTNLDELSVSAKVKCPDELAAKEMVKEITDAGNDGDTVGGVIKVIATGLPAGLGSFVHYDRRLSSKIAAAVMGIPACKGVEFGKGFECARIRGTKLHDPIRIKGENFFSRDSNNAGGLEGGMTNSEPLEISAVIKPISMVGKKAITTVDIKNCTETMKSSGERADVSAVPSATVVGESVVAIELANAMIEKFGGDHISEIKENYENYMRYVTSFYNDVKKGV